MTSLTKIDFDADCIEHWMPLRSAKAGEVQYSILPETIEKMFEIDPDLAAVSIEYISHMNGHRLDVTLPLGFWRHDEDGAHPETLAGLNESLLWEISPALASPDDSAQHSLIPARFYQAAPQISGNISSNKLLSIYMRDVSFYMPSDLASSLEDVNEGTYTSKRDLAEAMQDVFGQAWHITAGSNHGALEQRKRLKRQAATFDAIILQQTGISFTTHLDPSLNI